MEPDTRHLEPLQHSAKMTWQSTCVACIILVAACVVCFLIDAKVSQTSLAMVYVLAVALCAYLLAPLASLVCAVSAVTLFNFFFVPPRWTFSVDGRENVIALLTMLTVAVVISHLTSKLRHNSYLARLHATRSEQLQRLASELLDIDSENNILLCGQASFDRAFSGSNYIASLEKSGQLHFPNEARAPKAEGIWNGMYTCMREAAALGPGTGRWPGLNAWYVPIGQRQQMFGAACIQQVKAKDLESREHALALCSLLAQALQRVLLTQKMLDSQDRANRQQIQSTFLAAISHDLRTPLAALVGAASALQTQGRKLENNEQQRLLSTLLSEAAYLNTVTENTLQLVQLSNASVNLSLDWESLEEIVGAVLGRLRTRDTLRRIGCAVQANLPLIQVNGVLMAQLLNNLLDNALKYSSGPISIVVQLHNEQIALHVKDRGETIPEAMQEVIFEPYARNDHSGQRGAGIGLALCRAIAQAHRANLTLRRRVGGGNDFILSIPLTKAHTAMEKAQ